MIRLLATVCILAVPGVAAQAQSLVIGAGYANFNAADSQETARISLEYHHTPFHESGALSVGFGGVLSDDDLGNAFFGVGVVAKWTFDRGWFLEGSFMPTYYRAGEPSNDLGGDLQFRSLIGVGRQLPRDRAVSVALTHLSNGSINQFNPGANAILVRYHMGF